MCPEDLIIPEKVSKALATTEQVYLELDMDDPQMMAQLQSAMLRLGGPDVKTLMTEAEYQTLDQWLTTNYGAGMAQMGMVKPFGLLSMVLVKSMSCPQPAGYEMELIKSAMATEQEVLGLESVADQIGVFDAIDEKTQYEWLIKYITEPEEATEELADMMALYKKEDLTALLAKINESPEYQGLEDQLLYDRNENWIPKMVAAAKEKPTFFAVGAGHLAADRGVIALLKKEGYTVTPIF